MPALDIQPAHIATPSPATPHCVLLIADDLTGACDAAAAFLGESSVRVWLGATGDPDGPDAVQAFNTDSRNLPPLAAAQSVANCASQHPGDALLFKKVDSAGRGPIAAELLAAQHAFNTDLTVFTPSFPTLGRIVSNGILHVYPASGLGTRLPLCTLFPITERPAITVVTQPSALARAAAAGYRIAICDAQTDDDLASLVTAAKALPQRILYAGSAGLAHALAATRCHTPAPAHNPLPTAASSLLIVGTQHPVTLLQLAHLNQHRPKTTPHIIRCEAGDADSILSRFAQLNPETLILTGGDTALLTLRTLGARSISLRGEIAPGIPWGIIDGGLAHNRTVVTKSGGFGAPDALTHILTTLSGNA
jgi:uncharacterized protein YgbK (DUF1537 family)